MSVTFCEARPRRGDGTGWCELPALHPGVAPRRSRVVPAHRAWLVAALAMAHAPELRRRTLRGAEAMIVPLLVMLVGGVVLRGARRPTRRRRAGPPRVLRGAALARLPTRPGTAPLVVKRASPAAAEPASCPAQLRIERDGVADRLSGFAPCVVGGAHPGRPHVARFTVRTGDVRVVDFDDGDRYDSDTVALTPTPKAAP